MDREGGNKKKMRKCRVNISSFPHSLSISSPFPHFLPISSSFSHSFSIFLQPGCHNLCNPGWDYEVSSWSRFCLCLVKILKFNFNENAEAEAWPRIWGWYIIKIWLVIWPQEVTLVSRTQPSSPLSLWQSFKVTWGKGWKTCLLGGRQAAPERRK